jgi:dGTPase
VLDNAGLTSSQKADFLKWEGNAQTFRILTRLQLISDDYGLNLTYATLAAVLKYPVSAGKVSGSGSIARKKHGFFQSEGSIVNEVWGQTGLSEGIRHPLTYVMEACDDICYTVLDAEDATKKALMSFADLCAYLRHHADGDPLVKRVVKAAEGDHLRHRELTLSPAELNDLSMQKFRVHAIAAMVAAAFQAYSKYRAAVDNGTLETDLLDASDAATLRNYLKKFDTEHAYRHKSVLSVESLGCKTIHGLMNVLWRAIKSRKSEKELGSARTTPFLRYAYQRISENYRRIFESSSNNMPVRYKEAQLLTDMISGMTDSFAVSLLRDLRKYDNSYSNEHRGLAKAN